MLAYRVQKAKGLFILQAKLSLVMAAIFSCHLALGQSPDNIEKTIKGDTVTLTYDLNSHDENINYEIRLYGIAGNNRQRLFRVDGDVGRYVRGGLDKKITWVHNVELLRYKMKEISFDIQFSFLDPVVSVSYPEYKSILKREKTYQIKWLGGERVKLELMHGRTSMLTLGDAKNKGSFDWKVASTIRPGKNYRIKVASESNPDLYVLSKPFKIKRKIPLGLKIIPFIGVAAAVLIATDNSSDNSTELPEPINPN